MHLVLNNLIFMISEALASKQKVVLCELKEKQLLVASHHSPVFSFCKEKVLWLLRNVWAQLYDATFLKLGRDFCLLTNITRCIKNSTSKIAKKMKYSSVWLEAQSSLSSRHMWNCEKTSSSLFPALHGCNVKRSLFIVDCVIVERRSPLNNKKLSDYKTRE